MTYRAGKYTNKLTMKNLQDIVKLIHEDSYNATFSIHSSYIDVLMRVDYLIDGEHRVIEDRIILKDFSIEAYDFDSRDLQVPYRELMANVFGKKYSTDYLLNF